MHWKGPQNKPTRPPEEVILRGYETGNPSVKGMTIFLISFVVGVGLCFVALWALYLLLFHTLPPRPRSPLLGNRTPVPAEPLKQPGPLQPPRPRLQPSGSLGEWSIAHSPPMDFKTYHRRQQALLGGWSIDLWSGALGMPIQTAMTLAARRLPTRPSPPKHLPRPNDSGGFEP